MVETQGNVTLGYCADSQQHLVLPPPASVQAAKKHQILKEPRGGHALILAQKGLHQLQMAPLVPDDSLQRFSFFKIKSRISKLSNFHPGEVLPSNVVFTSDGA